MNDRLLSVVASLGYIFFFVLVVAPKLPSKNINDTDAKKKLAFVESSKSRLDSNLNNDLRLQLQVKAQLWQKTYSEDDWLAVTNAIHAAAVESSVRSTVTIDSSRGIGATVKYQTLGQRKRNDAPTTGKRPTELIESMYIGVYHIWLERNGRVTSDKDAEFEIVNNKEKVTLEEKK